MPDAIPLGYAPADNARLHWWIFIIMVAVLEVVGAAAGGLVGQRLTPVHAGAVALYQYSGPQISQAAVQQAVAKVDASLRTPSTDDAIIADLNARGHVFPTGQTGRQQLHRGLTIRVIPNSRLIQIAYESNDAQLCSDVLRAYTDVDGLGLFTPWVPTYRRSAVGSVLGILIGASAVLLAAFWYRRRQRQDGPVRGYNPM